MNKNKKIAAAVVSTVMAGTMAFTFAACTPTKEPDGPDNKPPVTVEDEWGILNKDGTVNYDAYKRESEVTLNLGVGHNSATTSTVFASDMGTKIHLPDGKEYSPGDLKPAWVQMGTDLNITFRDVFRGKDGATSGNLKTMTTTSDTDGVLWYDKTDLFTTDLSVAVEYAAKGTNILNLADYLNYMPNFTKFLKENPVVYLSLLQDGMDTQTGEDQTIYIAPYFDGYDDIERYCIVRQDWTAKLLNGSTATGSTATYASACAATTYVQPYMTADYEIQCLNEAGTDTITIKKNYTNALAEVKKSGSALYNAYNAIAGEAYAGDSGNIVAIMNAAIAKNANATGAQLTELYRAYIDACYQKDGASYYAADKRANVFNGYDACWDVDDLVAVLRCVMTNTSYLVDASSGFTALGGIATRDGTIDRTPDIVSLAGQLYGVRGATSRYDYSYIDKDGTLQYALENEELFNACANLNLLVKEGLIASYGALGDFATASGIGTKDSNKTTEYFMVYDYSQTQTLYGFYAEDTNVTGKTVPSGYYFSPVLTPVAKWDVDGDGNHTDLMRFTESWRSTKTSGLALNGALAKKGNEDKLKAALQLVDYLYSEDGQIVSTFGPMATNANGAGGFWYNTKATDAEITSGSYFTYKGVKYAGSNYKGEYTPTITSALYESFKGLGNYADYTTGKDMSGAKLSFTSYARMIIGTTLPVGVKDQSFENQLTSQMGQNGAGKVGVALAKGVVKGMTLDIDPANYWYTCIPSGLPVPESRTTNVLNATYMTDYMYSTGTKKTSSKTFMSIMAWIVLYGTNSTYNQQDVSIAYTSIADLYTQVISKNGNTDMTYKALATARENVYKAAWETAKAYWTYLSK